MPVRVALKLWSLSISPSSNVSLLMCVAPRYFLANHRLSFFAFINHADPTTFSVRITRHVGHPGLGCFCVGDLSAFSPLVHVDELMSTASLPWACMGLSMHPLGACRATADMPCDVRVYSVTCSDAPKNVHRALIMNRLGRAQNRRSSHNCGRITSQAESKHACSRMFNLGPSLTDL